MIVAFELPRDAEAFPAQDLDGEDLVNAPVEVGEQEGVFAGAGGWHGRGRDGVQDEGPGQGAEAERQRGPY